MVCYSVLGLQEALQLLRADDDKIIYKLNTSLPTTSFSEQGSATEHCKDLYQQVVYDDVCPIYAER